MAWLFRGNRAVAILPQFVVNAGTMIPLAVGEYYLGCQLLPGDQPDARELAAGLQRAFDAWSWSAPWTSTVFLFTSDDIPIAQVYAPLLLGATVAGASFALLAYPLILVGVRAWRKRHPLPASAEPRAPFAIPERPASKPSAAYVDRPDRFLHAEQIELLVDGAQAYPEMLAAIEAAQSSVDLETYILRADRTGERFADALRRSARNGVRVRLLYDAVGSLGLPDRYIQALLDAGVQVADYHPLTFSRPLWAWNKRNHRKILVVDGRASFTGGLNISDDYAPRDEGGAGWRDTHVRIDGERVARELTRLFDGAWAKSRRWSDSEPEGKPLERSARVLWRPAADPGAARVPVLVLGNTLFRNRHRIRGAYLYAIKRAERYILIENAYFIPDRGIRRALYAAAKRGVAVGVVVAQHSDVEIAAAAGRALYSELLDHGVRLFEWPGSMLHAKTAAIDDAWALVGSYNIDHRSLFHQLEAVAVTTEAPFVRALRDQTRADMARCRELTLADHEARPLKKLLWESLMYQFRYWL